MNITTPWTTATTSSPSQSRTKLVWTSPTTSLIISLIISLITKGVRALRRRWNLTIHSLSRLTTWTSRTSWPWNNLYSKEVWRGNCRWTGRFRSTKGPCLRKGSYWWKECRGRFTGKSRRFTAASTCIKGRFRTVWMCRGNRPRRVSRAKVWNRACPVPRNGTWSGCRWWKIITINKITWARTPSTGIWTPSRKSTSC